METKDSALERAKEVAVLAELGSLTKSSFLAYLSHELRNPMNGMMGMMRLLEDTYHDDQQRKYLESAMHAGQKLLDVVKEVTEFSNIDPGILSLDHEAFNLSDACKDVVKFLSGDASVKNINFRFSYDDQLPALVHGDAVRLKQVLGNIVSNAIRFTEKGSVVLEVKPGNMADDKPVIQFDVKDTGQGIPKEKLASIFDFSDHETINTRQETVMSLELSVCKYIIEKMGGQITVDSEVGKGTTFSILVPFTAATENTMSTTAAAPKAPVVDDTPFSYNGITALVAEDDPINQMLAKAYIRRLGGTVEIAGNGRIAVEQYKTGKFDVIFMDCEMPEMDGYDATKEIRSLEGDKKTPIIAMTAYATRGDRERCLAAGMDSHIPKPVTFEALEQVLREFLVPDQLS